MHSASSAMVNTPPPADPPAGGGGDRSPTPPPADPAAAAAAQLAAALRQAAGHGGAGGGPATAVPRQALKQPECFTGDKKQVWATWLSSALIYFAALNLCAASDIVAPYTGEAFAAGAPLVLALLGYIQGNALRVLLLQIPNLVKASLADIERVMLSAPLAGNTAHTDFSARQRMERLTLKRASNGTLDVSNYLSTFKSILLVCTQAVDPSTAIWLVHRQLPAQLASAVTVDPATNKQFVDFEAYCTHLLAHVDSYNQHAASRAAPTPKGAAGKAGGGDTPANKRPKLKHGKDNGNGRVKGGAARGGGAAPGSDTPFRGTCYKCGEKGHKANDCKNPAKK